MLVFPQLSTGCLAQYPIQKRRSERSVTNLSEDGHVTSLWDQDASRVKWQLAYAGLTDQEVTAITSFYSACEGELQPFLFLDPTANSFEYSEDFSQPAWARNSLLTFATGIDDPFGASRASRFINTSQGALSLTQTVAIPGTVSCTFSAYVRAAAGVACQMERTDGSTVQLLPIPAQGLWTRVALHSAFASSISTSCDYSILVPAGQTVDLFGFQLEPQTSPGKYVATTSQTGVYPNTRFDMSALAVTATGPGQSALTVSLLSKASR